MSGLADEAQRVLDERVREVIEQMFGRSKPAVYRKEMGTMDETLIERCARSAHEVNRAYCQALGDLTQAPWESAPDWQRDSARNGVRAVLGNPAHTPEQSHEGWLRQKREEGWTFGPVKDPERKTHPCMVHYQDLPAAQRAKDHIFVAVVREVARSSL